MQASKPGDLPAFATFESSGPQRRLSAYVATWVMLAASGLSYLGVVAVRPDLLGGAQGEPANTAQIADLAEQLASTKGWLRDLENELGETRRQLSAERERAARFMEQVTAAELRSRPAVEPEKHAGVILPPPASTEAAAASSPPPMPGFRILNSAAGAGGGAVSAPVATRQSPIVTGAIEGSGPAKSSDGAAAPAPSPSAPISFGAAKVVPAAGPAAIEIADAENLDALRQSWSSISSGNTDVLRRLSARYRISADGGREKPFTLLAGPFPTTAEARRACVALKARGVVCKVGDFSGNAM